MANKIPQEDSIPQLLKEIHKRGGTIRPSDKDHTGRDLYEALADHFKLSKVEREKTYLDKGRPKSSWEARVRAWRQKAVDSGYIEPRQSSKGEHHTWVITEKGKQLIGSNQPDFNNIFELEECPKRTYIIVRKINRDSSKTIRMKEKYSYQCQVCQERIVISNNRYYAEVHHIRPLGGNHQGLDIEENMIVLCPNHHAMFDLGIPFFVSSNKVRIKEIEKELYLIHKIDENNINYHNRHIFGSSNKI